MSTTEHTESTEPEKTGDRVYFRVFSDFRGEDQNPESQPGKRTGINDAEFIR